VAEDTRDRGETGREGDGQNYEHGKRKGRHGVGARLDGLRGPADAIRHFFCSGFDLRELGVEIREHAAGAGRVRTRLAHDGIGGSDVCFERIVQLGKFGFDFTVEFEADVAADRLAHLRAIFGEARGRAFEALPVGSLRGIESLVDGCPDRIVHHVGFHVVALGRRDYPFVPGSGEKALLGDE